MSYQISDRWLGVSLGITLVVGLYGVAQILPRLAEAVAVPEKDDGGLQDEYAMVEKVDEISLESLRVLATGQNANIRRA